MKAVTVEPGKVRSALLEEIPEPSLKDGAILAKTIAVGVCGTDLEILAGEYGAPAPSKKRLVLGHEALAKVVACPDHENFSVGDLFVPIVRRPDPVPCPSCAVNEWDMCSNGEYTERGIKGEDGYASEYFRIAPAFAVKVPMELGLVAVLTEPTSVVAKAWDHIDSIVSRSQWKPKTALITGAGPVGLLAALFARQKGLETHVLDREPHGLKPALVKELGATYHLGPLSEAGKNMDIIIECTGAAEVVLQLINLTSPNSIKCLAGVPPTQKKMSLDVGLLTRKMVLDNEVIFGSVNANRTHYRTAVNVLNQASKSWLQKMITRTVPVENWMGGLERRPDDIKSVILFDSRFKLEKGVNK